MSEKVYLIPETGKKVRDPQRGDHLPPEGREVVMSSYWRRRMNEGGVKAGRKPTPAKKSRSESSGSGSGSSGSDGSDS